MLNTTNLSGHDKQKQDICFQCFTSSFSLRDATVNIHNDTGEHKYGADKPRIMISANLGFETKLQEC